MSASQLVFRRDGRIHITAGEGRDRLADVVRSCAQLHSVVAGDYLFELSDAALWGAATRGRSSADLLSDLDAAASEPVPAPLAARIADVMGRWGRLRLENRAGEVVVATADAGLLRRLSLEAVPDADRWIAAVSDDDIGRIKIAAMKIGWPVADCRPPRFRLTPYATTVALRPYQQRAVEAFVRGGSGIVLLPCGAGKTVVGVAAAASVGGATLVVTHSRTISEQWREAFLDSTSLPPSFVRANARTVGDERVSIVTYHAATTGRIGPALAERAWDLVIYDEVQSLPADVFRLAAAFQSSRRLGLTATLVREDGREREVSALVGPALFDVSWLELERQGWIAPARCVEVRIPAASSPRERERYRLATLKRLLAAHADEPVLVAGTRVDGLRRAGALLGFPVLTGESSAEERMELLGRFRDGSVPVLGISRIGTVGVDLPNATTLVQLSGTYGSRQEEAQRLGRVLRPGLGKTAHFYALVVSGTAEEEYARRRQRFLVSQGYQYEVLDAGSLPRPDAPSGDLASEQDLRR